MSAVDKRPRAEHVALAKAAAVSAGAPGRYVLGADTIVEVDGEELGKPPHAADAARMLRQLSGRWHTVTSGVALVRDRAAVTRFAVCTRVRFADWSAARIERYVRMGEYEDKAGGYAIQGAAGALVERIEGSYTNVVGLPVAEVIAALRQHHVIEDLWAEGGRL